jgi:hypothetical protein
MQITTRRSLTAITLALAVLLVSAAPSPAPVTPRNCGISTIGGKRYQIKADQIRCSTAKRWARTYLNRHRRPSGYSCRNYSSSTKLKFRCTKREKVFFAIKR